MNGLAWARSRKSMEVGRPVRPARGQDRHKHLFLFLLFIIGGLNVCELRSKPVKFSCCSTNFWVLNDPVAGQRAALTAHAGSRHHQVCHIALLYDHTGDARACTPSRGVKWNQDSMRGVSVSEPSPTSLPPNPSDASDASPSLAESSSDPVSSALASSSLSLAFGIAAAQRLLFVLCA